MAALGSMAGARPWPSQRPNAAVPLRQIAVLSDRRRPGSRSLGAAPRHRRLTPRASVEPLVAEGLFEATGVPLLDVLMRFKTMDAAIAHSTQLASTAVAAAVAGCLLLYVVERVAGKRIATGGTGFNAPLAVLCSAFKPAKVLLPWYAATYVTTVGAALAQVAATRLKKDFAALCGSRQDQILGWLRHFTQLTQDISELLIIVFVAWALIDFKNRCLGWLATSILSDSSASNDTMVTLLRPLSGVLTFLILLVATAFTLGAFGLNLGPLLASVGGIGVVVGLATQQLLTNVVSAIALFTGRPFEVGDDIVLLAGPMVVVEGSVAQIEPMRTIVRSRDGGIVYVNNAEVTNYVIKNMTQGRSLAAVTTAAAHAEKAHRGDGGVHTELSSGLIV